MGEQGPRKASRVAFGRVGDTVRPVNEHCTVRVLKADSFGRVECLALDDQNVLRRVACGGRWPASAWVARLLLRRERRALQALEGEAGFPKRLAASGSLEGARQAQPEDGRATRRALVHPDGVLLREYVAGRPLSQAQHLPHNFFDRLEELVERMHARGVCHNDLHKEPNVLVAEDGFPVLIDFQLASVHPRRGRAFRVRCHEDLRHVQKHRRRYLRDGRGPEGLAPPPAHERLRRKPLSWVWRKTGKPLYEFITRRWLGYSDGEARRPSSGPWPQWGPPLPPWPPAKD